ncbi:efflux RND transporter periplasmic adaptor subunit [Aquabacterium sp. A7-Y]|uniref:efflux RND transporter periplasmic adaptor subunit n=1 Tax=Aquabacterium sp. A7-Y TaxID=1349605 RepID=UPI00223D0B23|nr:efflux RND transporter periplasmic adaptor subunit [Aquabacterium sp. A7-Y]MCW7539711.1 efflux RND transporter periplasmic adaptor subunit [Aquabacterium sp. A7-Y]
MQPTFPSIRKKQALVIAVLLALGVAGGVAILRTEPARPGETHGQPHGDAHQHAEAEGHADEQAETPDHRHESAENGRSARHEGVIRLSDAQIRSAAITLEASRPAPIGSTLQLPGEIRFNEDRTAHVVPRVAGVVESVSAGLGQQVGKGQVLAVISSPEVSELRSELQAAQRRQALAKTTYEREQKLWEEKISPEQDLLQAQQALREAEIAVANAHQKLQALGAGASATSLNRFELRAPFGGMVVEKHLALGEVVKDDTRIFTISDLSSVWAVIDVPARALNQLRVGDKVQIRSSAFDETASGTVAHVGALIGEQTRTAQARVTLPNPRGAWRPGLFVTVEGVASDAEAPVTVAKDALQTLDGRQVVFVKVPGGFLPQPVVTGRSDARRVEIVQGLKAGVAHAAAGSFVVKSEVGKTTAEHVH